VFILLSVVILFNLQRYLESRSRRHLLLAAIATSLACVERYIGVTLIVTGLLLVLAGRQHRSRRAALGFCALSGSLLTIWLVRNILCTSTLMGSRERSHTSLVHSAAVAAHIVSAWFLPRFVPPLLIVALIVAMSFTGRKWVRPAAVFAAVYFV